MADWKSTVVVHHSRKSPVTAAEVEISELQPSQVLVKTEYGAINPVDIKLHTLSFTNGEQRPLKEFSGVIEAVGNQVNGKYSIGDKVWGMIMQPNKTRFVGSYTVVDAEKDIMGTVPTSLTLEEASAFGVGYGTGFSLLECANKNKKLGPESSILVLGGATTVGTYTIQLAKKYYNVGTVVSTCSSSSADYVKTVGADAVIDYRAPDVRGEFIKFVQNSGKKFDAVLDAAGGYDALAVSNQILEPVAKGSAYASVIGDSSPSKTYAETMVKSLKNLPLILFRAVFGKYYGLNYYFVMVGKGKWIDSVPEFFSIPNVKVPIDSIYSVGDIKDAWAKVDSTRIRGKVLIKF